MNEGFRRLRELMKCGDRGERDEGKSVPESLWREREWGMEEEMKRKMSQMCEREED